MKHLDENIWAVEMDFKLMAAELGNRMTIIRLPSGKLLLHSPVKLTAQLADEVEKLGRVAFIITPNNFHGLFASEWCSHYPDAIYYSARKKTEGIFTILNESLENELESVVRIIKFDGAPKVNEFAFIHMPSKTLILTDMAFNIGCNVSRWSRIFFTMNGSFNTFGPSRLMKSMFGDSELLQESIKKILQTEFNRIIVSHGDIIESDGKSKFRMAFMNALNVGENADA